MTFVKIADYLPELIPLILVIGLSVGLYYYNVLDGIHKSLFFYLFLMLITDYVSRFFSQDGNNLIILIVYSFVELLAVAYFYYKYMFKNKHKLVLVMSIMAMLYIMGELFFNLFFNVNVQHFQPYAKIADNFVIILLALSFLYEKVSTYKESRWDNFTLNITVLVFFTLSALIFLPFNFLVNEKSGVKFYFLTGNVVLLLFFYGFLTWLIWKNGRQNKLISHNFNKK